MGIAIVICLAFSIWAASIASSKNLNVLGYALLAFFLPLIGVIAAVNVSLLVLHFTVFRHRRAAP